LKREYAAGMKPCQQGGSRGCGKSDPERFNRPKAHHRLEDTRGRQKHQGYALKPRRFAPLTFPPSPGDRDTMKTHPAETDFNEKRDKDPYIPILSDKRTDNST